MRFMMIVKADENSEAGVMPSMEIIQVMGKFNEELVKAGALLAAEGLQPSSKGLRTKMGPGGGKTMIDGPFAETKELIAGFWLIQVGSREEAVDWARRCPAEIELRQVYDPEDFGVEAGEQERALRKEVEKIALKK